MAVAISEKQYFKIGEVSDILDLAPYVLRYWEAEFNILKPGRTRTHVRLYQRKDLELLMEIKHLLYDERLTVAGAKIRLQMMKKQALTDKKAKKMTKNINSNQESELTVVKTGNDKSFENLGDFKELLFDIRKELQALRSRLEGQS